METTRTETINVTKTRGPAVNALAVVGFIALILIGMAVAIYAARFVPAALSNIGQAAVSLSNVFTPDARESGIEVVPTYTNNGGAVVTLPIGTTTTSTTENPAMTPSTPAYTAPPGANYTTPLPPTYRVVTVPISSTYYGDADLSIEILAIGYVTRDNTSSSFRESSRVPEGEQGAVKFRIFNSGTNASGRFEYEASVRNAARRTETATNRAPSLNPGISVITYAYFDARKSGDTDITIEVDTDNDVRESNERNNSDTADIRVRN